MDKITKAQKVNISKFHFIETFFDGYNIEKHQHTS